MGQFNGKIYQVRDWDLHFENSASRKLKRLDWVAVPNKMDGSGYVALVDHPNGAAHLGAWYAIVEVASKQKPRGRLPYLPGGICQCLGRISRLPSTIFEEVLPRLLEIGWIEEVKQVQLNQQSANTSGESASTSGESASTSGEDGATGNYIEGNITPPLTPPLAEGGTEKGRKPTRTEQRAAEAERQAAEIAKRTEARKETWAPLTDSELAELEKQKPQ